MTSEPEYHVLMLRAWQDSGVEAAFRFSVENPRTGRRIGFATLDELIEYLRFRFGLGRDADMFFSGGE